jgi:TonB family protein
MSSNRPGSGRWSARTVFLVAIVLAHAGLFYLVATQRSRLGSGDDRQAFLPIEGKTGSSTGSLTDTATRRDKSPPAPRFRGVPRKKESAAVPVVTLWRFAPFDVWPAQANWPDNSPALEGTRAAPQEPRGVQVASSEHGVAIKSGTWPEYPVAWAQADEDGSVVLQVGVDEQGKATDVSVQNSSASSRLEAAAKRAVSTWTFSRPVAMPAGARIELEMRFNAYRQQLWRVTRLMSEGGAQAYVEKVSSAEALRNLINDLSSPVAALANLENAQPDFQKMRSTVLKWGQARQVRLINPEESAWHEYIVHPEFRSNTYGGAIPLRWDLYDVRHEKVRAHWKVATDFYGRIWAAKADTR